jgi:hypothetical protein
MFVFVWKIFELMSLCLNDEPSQGYAFHCGSLQEQNFIMKIFAKQGITICDIEILLDD